MFVNWRGKLLNLDHIAVIEVYCNEVNDMSVHGHMREEWGVRIYGPTRKIIASADYCQTAEEADAVMNELKTLCIRKNYDGGMSG